MEVSAQVGDIDNTVWEQQVSAVTGGMATKAIWGVPHINMPNSEELTDAHQQNKELMENSHKILASICLGRALLACCPA